MLVSETISGAPNRHSRAKRRLPFLERSFNSLAIGQQLALGCSARDTGHKRVPDPPLSSPERSRRRFLAATQKP